MSKKRNSDLQTAQQLFAKKQYAQVISLLSPQIFLYRKEVRFHKLLAFACLYSGDYGGAYSYFQRARDIKHDEIDVILGLALVMIRRRKTTEALQLWLEVLDLEPDNSQAKRALQMARELEEDEWLELIDEGRFHNLLPRHPRPGFTRFIPAVIAISATIVVVVAAFFVYRLLTAEEAYRSGEELLQFDSSEYSQGDYSNFASIIFTDEQLQDELSNIEVLFRQYRDNLVRFNGNRILMSNAPLEVKDRISLLLSQLQAPDFTNFSDGFSYPEIEQEPELYHGVYVRWRGRIANVVESADVISFDLLVGFESGRVVEGRVPVLLDFAVELQGGEAVELIGRLSTSNGLIAVQGSSIRRIQVEGQ